jgi:hypothetical protein
VRIPAPAPNKFNQDSEKSAQSPRSGDVVAASIGLNKPRTVPTCPIELGKRRAKRSRKVLMDRLIKSEAPRRLAPSAGRIAKIPKQSRRAISLPNSIDPRKTRISLGT